MIKISLLTFLFLNFCLPGFTQKDCSYDHTGLIPITDLGTGNYRGHMGGLYPEGSNVRPEPYLNKCIEHVQQIKPLNMDGEFVEDGKIVMLAIGASNPGGEFEKFKNQTSDFIPLNDQLEIINGCIDGIGIQEMNPDDEYWEAVLENLEVNGLSPEQVQICWIEEENTLDGDTTFPSAALNLVTDYLNLLTAIKTIFPNIKICYLSARVYSGFAGALDDTFDNGLEFPRDYLNGWAVKWFIENIINNEAGYDYEGAGAQIPLVTWATYNWTDGSTPRMDGLFLDCELDFSEDGLHLSGPGDQKIGELMFNYFKTDTTAKYWFYDEGYTVIENQQIELSDLHIYPNPVVNNNLHIQSDLFQINENVNIIIQSIDGKLMYSSNENYSNEFLIHLPELNNGIYIVSLESEKEIVNNSFIYSE